MLSFSFGMKEPSSLETVFARSEAIDLDLLAKCGRSLPIDKFLETKLAFLSNPDEVS